MEDTLLYIDSEPATRLLVRRVLGSAGFRVLEAESLDSGRLLAEQARPEIVLLDVDDDTAPAGLLPAFRKSPGMERSVFLASTADDRPARTEDLVACGFQGVLVKPLDIEHPGERTQALSGARRLPRSCRPRRYQGACCLGIRSRWRVNFGPNHGAARSQRGCGRRSAGCPRRGSDRADGLSPPLRFGARWTARGWGTKLPVAALESGSSLAADC